MAGLAAAVSGHPAAAAGGAVRRAGLEMLTGQRILDPNQLLGELLLPLVSLSVGLILFEGG